MHEQIMTFRKQLFMELNSATVRSFLPSQKANDADENDVKKTNSLRDNKSNNRSRKQSRTNDPSKSQTDLSAKNSKQSK